MAGETGSITRWRTNKQAQTDRFEALLDDPQTCKHFDVSWVKSLAKRIEKQRTELIAVIMTSLVPTSYLALTLLHVDVAMKLVDIKDPARLFQISLLATCFLGLLGAVTAITHEQSRYLLQIWTRRTVGGYGSALYLLAYDVPRYAQPQIFDPLLSTATPTTHSKVATYIAILSVHGVGAAVAAVTFCFQIWGIFRVSAQSGAFASIVTGLAIAMTVVNFLVLYPVFGVPRAFKFNAPNRSSIVQDQ